MLPSKELQDQFVVLQPLACCVYLTNHKSPTTPQIVFFLLAYHESARIGSFLLQLALLWLRSKEVSEVCEVHLTKSQSNVAGPNQVVGETPSRTAGVLGQGL